jgi:hypothetical protein
MHLPWALLLRFTLLAGLAGALAMVDAKGFFRGVSSERSVAYAAENLYVLLPVVVGITLASFRHARRRGAFVLMLAATLLMISTDFLPGSADVRSETSMVYVKGSGRMERATVAERWNGPGALLAVGSHLLGRIPDEELEVRPSYRLDDGRYRLAQAYMKVGFLVLPAVIGGLVVGGIRWMDRGMLFTSRAAETIAEFLLGWLVGPLTLLIALVLGRQVVSLALYEGAPLAALFLPFLTLLGLSLAGWVTAAGGESE